MHRDRPPEDTEDPVDGARLVDGLPVEGFEAGGQRGEPRRAEGECETVGGQVVTTLLVGGQRVVDRGDVVESLVDGFGEDVCGQKASEMPMPVDGSLKWLDRQFHTSAAPQVLAAINYGRPMGSEPTAWAATVDTTSSAGGWVIRRAEEASAR